MMCDNNSPSTQSIADYLAQLLKDRKQLAAFPNVFMHMERLLDEDICLVECVTNSVVRNELRGRNSSSESKLPSLQDSSFEGS
ncbi:unnamed protein product [Spodoptera littoralis]|uniref:STAR protein homodimerisation region domain-containing protein n=1 Tax=Spodoptera littoralis TaxID=7109 RepID=A0A9P0HWB6_SPOLI|nr:unnamed protein product [Spodoptera littoralis]CAH1635722.1 unnamed protein product [Spodoptera littoralis]